MQGVLGGNSDSIDDFKQTVYINMCQILNEYGDTTV